LQGEPTTFLTDETFKKILELNLKQVSAPTCQKIVIFKKDFCEFSIFHTIPVPCLVGVGIMLPSAARQLFRSSILFVIVS